MIDRVVIIVLDGVGAGAMPDAESFGDIGANTLTHTLTNCPDNYFLQNLALLGLYSLLGITTKEKIELIGSYGKMLSASAAKDTLVGHWEISGVIERQKFNFYPNGFPENIISEFEREIGTKTLCNKAVSGTQIINTLGDEHCKTGFPIVYTSADSVFQIAAHEEIIPLDKLYEYCLIARKMLVGKDAVARVIARPFRGVSGNYFRTPNRKDYPIQAPQKTLLEKIKENSGEVIAIGKINDVFCGRGITKSVHTNGNIDGIKHIIKEILFKKQSSSKDLIFANLIDFDTLWGHRRDLTAFREGLMYFDTMLPEIIASLKDTDILIITADHGCDPTFLAHTDHTREMVPLLVYSKNANCGVDLGVRETFADIAQSVCQLFSLEKFPEGESFVSEIFMEAQ